MNCLVCGQAIAGSGRFCSACGAPAPIQCAECGAGNPPATSYCSGCGTPLVAAEKGMRPAGPPAEQRQITILLCDLVDSTPLAQRLDPEDLRQVIAKYHAVASDTIASFGGSVAQFIGDGVLAYFGYPRAGEDDAECAVRTGLALVDTIRATLIAGSASLQVRVGIATGLVIVSESSPGSCVGEALNLATRLQTLARPSSVVICGRTRRLVGRRFHYEDLGRVTLKGFAAAIQSYRALWPSDVRSRFTAHHEGPLARLVGRQEELDVLLRRWRNATQGEGSVVLLCGEPGIGKSRLSRALQQRIADEPYTRLSHACHPHHSSSALFPIISHLARAAGFTPEDLPEAKRRKLEAMLAQTQADEAEVDILAELLSVPTGSHANAPDPGPHRRKERMLDALLSQLRSLCEQRPVLMLFEDVHWLDPTSLELLTLIVERAARWPLLVLVTARPEFVAPWPHYAHVTTISLSRLGAQDSAALINIVTKGKALPTDVQDQILDRADGVPLFVEELTKAVLERGLLREEAGRYALIGTIPATAIPETLQASLLARLDRHGFAREVAQIGAAIGREFAYSLINAVARLPAAKLHNALDDLTRSELVYRRGEPPMAIYAFKHALVRDVAYGTMLRSRRQQLHAAIADVIRHQTGIAETQPELVAAHFAEAERSADAVKWWLKAGQLALTRSANSEAAAHLRKALDLVESWPHDDTRHHQELELLSMLGTALIATHGYAAEQTINAYERGRELLRLTGDRHRQDAILSGLFVAYYNLAAFSKGLEVGREFLEWAEGSGDPLALCIGHRMLTASYNALGDFVSAARHGEAAVSNYDPERHASLAWRYIHDVGVAAMCHCAVAQWHLGNLSRASELIAETMALATRLNHRNTLGYALFYAALAALRNGDMTALGEHAPRLQKLGREHNLPHWLAWGLAFQTPVLLAEGHADCAVATADDAIAMTDRLGVLLFRPMLLGLRAQALAAAQRPADALCSIEHAFATAERTGERGHDAALWRLKGEILLDSDGSASAAECCFVHALNCARHQGSAMFEMHASIALARQWRDRGQDSDAASILARARGNIAVPMDYRERD